MYFANNKKRQKNYTKINSLQLTETAIGDCWCD